MEHTERIESISETVNWWDKGIWALEPDTTDRETLSNSGACAGTDCQACKMCLGMEG